MKFRRLTKGTDLTFPAFLAGAEAGRRGESLLAEARRLNPQLPIKWFAEHLGGLPPTNIVDGWRKAGLPEE